MLANLFTLIKLFLSVMNYVNQVQEDKRVALALGITEAFNDLRKSKTPQEKTDVAHRLHKLIAS